jgi:1A family penicillin-binding protein
MPKRMNSRITFGRSIQSVLSKVASFFVLIAAFCTLSVFFLFFYFLGDLPRPEDFTEKKLVESTKIYDRTGNVLLYELYGEEKRTVVPFDEIPDNVKKAVIATEDSNFYRHFGIDVHALIRSVIADLRIGKPVYGGSTITQQLIRSSYLTTKKSLRRKIREIVLAIELELRYSKDEIFSFYLNQVPFGNNAYGVEAASQTYFGKPVKELSLAEAATLAALIQRPSYYGDLSKNLEALLARKNYVLERMRQEGYITKEEKAAAEQEKINFQEIRQSLRAPHFVLYIRDQLLEKYGEDFLKENGLKVITTLDWDLQQLAEKIVKEGAERNKIFQAYNAALVALDPKTGEILAMVGSKDYFGKSEGCAPGKGCLFDPQVNIATYSIGRQPGSAFKPFVYATAFKKGYTDKTIVVDEPTNFGIYGGKPYMPQNYDGRFRGPVTLRSALAQSLNVPSVKVLAYLAGLEDSIKTAQEMGISTLTNPPSYYGLSLVLGGGEVRLLDMVSAYGVFATEGLRIPPTGIKRIEDQRGTILEENRKNPERVLESRVARLINDILSDNPARAPIFGVSSSLYIPGYQVAAKSGTTQDFKDGWVIGYTPSLVVGVWAGNNNGTPMSKDPAVITAGPIWNQFMQTALLRYPIEKFQPPDN